MRSDAFMKAVSSKDCKMLKNITLYRIGPDWAPDLSTVEEALGKATFAECGATQQKSSGFVSPRGEANGALVEAIDGQLILKLRTDTKRVPADVLAKRVDEIAATIEDQTGRKPGKKQRKELKEQALHELLPMAFTKSASTLVWIDQENRLLMIDSASQSKADEVVTLLAQTCQGLSMSLLQTAMSPAAAMTHWLGTGEAPWNFTIDRECELKSTDEMKSVVRYGRHNLDTDEVKQHIVSGKVPTRVAMTWRDRVSFILTDSMALKKLAFLDVVFEGAVSVDKGETFDADVAIATGELSQLIPDLVEALGGEQTAPAAPLLEVDGPDPMYDNAVAVVLKHGKASISLVQRHLRIGYNHAARLLEAMEKAGVVSHMSDLGQRTVLKGGAA